MVLAVTLERALHSLLNFCAILGFDKFQESFESAAERSRSHAENLLHVVRPVHVSSREVPVPGPKIAGLQAEFHFPLALPKLPLDLFDLGDIAGNLGGADDLAG